MASRGRGRGRSVSFNVEALGFSRGETLPAPSLQPPPLYPPQNFKPIALLQGEDYEYMLALKQEFRGTIRKSPFYLLPPEKKRDIERYSDKYQLGNDALKEWEPDWSRLPNELKMKQKKSRKIAAVVQPNIHVKRSKKEEVEIATALEILEKKENNDSVKEETETVKESEDKEEKDDEEDEIEEDYEDEELEEETDYILNYFDNGEGYGDDDDDVDEGPVY
ncbi:hypothetical protein ScPMuIL_017995 [Solemya velum]